MITDDQRKARQAGIGGSDSAAAIGLSPYSTPYKVWLEKTGQLERDEFGDNDFIHFGNVLEDIVATEFARRTGWRVARRNKTITHPKHKWMRANIDRAIVGKREGLECKTASFYSAKEWGFEGDQFPLHYLIQCYHYLAVTGWDRWHVAVLIAGNDFRRFTVERDENMIEDLIAKEEAFWQHVVNRTEPELINLDDAYMRWPKDYGAPIVASPNARRAFDRLMKLREEEKELEKKIDAEKLIIQQWMGDHSTLLDVDGVTRLCTWKTQTTKRINPDLVRKNHPDVAAACSYDSDSRVMRFVDKKK